MIELFQLGFMQRAMLAGILIGVVCALIGVFLVLKRLSLIGDGLAHVAFGGVALGVLANINPILSALGFALAGAFGTFYLQKNGKLYGETAIAILTATGLSTGVVLISLANGFTSSLFGFLFGSILTVTSFELWLTVILGLVVISAIIIWYKKLMFVCFDEEGAQAAGIYVNWLNILLNVLTAIVVVVSMKIVGILLVSALIVVPVATALQISRSFFQTTVYSVLFSVISVIFGLLASYYLDIAAGGAIVLASLLFLCITIIFKKIMDKSN